MLLRYSRANGWLDGQPAMITRRVGQASITCLGAVIDPNLHYTCHNIALSCAVREDGLRSPGRLKKFMTAIWAHGTLIPTPATKQAPR